MRKLTLLATVLAFVVIILGAYTRLTDAGLGCPDWPGCYGKMVVPTSQVATMEAAAAYPDTPLETTKAWTEMVHRYGAGILGLLIISVCLLAWRRRESLQLSRSMPIFLIMLLVFQALLGMWTVTLKLMPIVVMAHLLGGMTILALLWHLFLKIKPQAGIQPSASLRKFILFGFIILIVQLILGGWTSANYAGLICPDFPFCQGKWIPAMDFHRALNIFAYSASAVPGDHLGVAGRVSIHMMHRIGAVITGLYLGGLALYLIAKGSPLALIGKVLLILLLLQIALGIINVLWLLPLSMAVAHNAVAALLVLTMVTLWSRQENLGQSVGQR